MGAILGALGPRWYHFGCHWDPDGAENHQNWFHFGNFPLASGSISHRFFDRLSTCIPASIARLVFLTRPGGMRVSD